MKKMRLFCGVLGLCLGLVPEAAHGQSVDVLGTRAAGMGGAFTGVADDATAVYWNPAGLAAGAYFSLVLDAKRTNEVPDEGPRGRKQSSYFAGVTTPALGLSYYRLQTASAIPDQLLVPIDGRALDRNVTGASFVRFERLVTHHAGITLVQSVLPNVAVGSTLKLVRGIASTQILEGASARDALDVDDPQARGTTRFDLDVGVMASGRRIKAGFTVRNTREPEFTSPERTVLKLERQARVGVSYALFANWLVAADADLTKQEDAFGERRDAAVGIEGRLVPRLTVRSGLRLNTAGETGDGGDNSRRAVSFGASYAVRPSVLVDGVAVTGGDRAGRGWGIAARFVY